jgi:hypothetical protein
MTIFLASCVLLSPPRATPLRVELAATPRTLHIRDLNRPFRPFKVSITNISSHDISFSKDIKSVIVLFRDTSGSVSFDMNDMRAVDPKMRTLADLCVLRPGETLVVIPMVTWPKPRAGTFKVQAFLEPGPKWGSAVSAMLKGVTILEVEVSSTPRTVVVL